MLGTSKDIKYPGLNILPPGVERHVVNGGALTAFQIFPDDELEIINNEGNQICEIICFNKDGNCLLYTSPSPRDKRQSRMPSSA